MGPFSPGDDNGDPDLHRRPRLDVRALCVSLAAGHDRVVVKKSLRRLEAEGVLQGDRERKPGFKVRAVRIADDFPARQELQELLEACARAWPDIGRAVEMAFQRLEPRTKEHLRRRGLIPCNCHPRGNHPRSMPCERVAGLRRAAEEKRREKVTSLMIDAKRLA